MTYKGVILSKYCSPLTVGFLDGEAIEVFTRHSYEMQESRSKIKLEAIFNQSSFGSVNSAIELVESLKKRLKTDQENGSNEEPKQDDIIPSSSISIRIRSESGEIEKISISRFSSIEDLKAEYCKNKNIKKIDFVFDGISLKEGALEEILEDEDLIDAK